MENQIKKSTFTRGSRRLAFSILGMMLLTASLVFDKWWWQTGALVLIVFVVELLFAYVISD